jgi:hypothetical protein
MGALDILFFPSALASDYLPLRGFTSGPWRILMTNRKPSYAAVLRARHKALQSLDGGRNHEPILNLVRAFLEDVEQVYPQLETHFDPPAPVPAGTLYSVRCGPRDLAPDYPLFDLVLSPAGYPITVAGPEGEQYCDGPSALRVALRDLADSPTLVRALDEWQAFYERTAEEVR